MRKIIILLFLSGLVFVSCKKDYQCVCTNSSGTYDAGEPIEAKTKSGAKKKCEELSGGSTSCTAK